MDHAISNLSRILSSFINWRIVWNFKFMGARFLNNNKELRKFAAWRAAEGMAEGRKLVQEA